MSGSKLIVRYSIRLVVREWRRFVLSFLSLAVTAIVMMLILLLSNASTLLLDQQAKELLGGDISLESIQPIDVAAVWQKSGITPEVETQQVSFSGTLQSKEVTAPFSIKVVDAAFPLYGTFTLTEGIFKGVGESEIFLDKGGAERLGVGVGDTVSFGEKSYTVGGVIVADPTSLLSGFKFLPQALMSQSGFKAAAVDPALLRAEYVYQAKVSTLGASQKRILKDEQTASNGLLKVDIAGENRTGLQRGVQIVADFLVVAVLITSVLAAVNVYASTLYLVTVERKSLAILLSLGLTKRRLIYLLATALLYVVVGASVLGSLVGLGTFSVLRSFIASSYTVTLPNPNFLEYTVVTIVLIAAIAIASFVPAIKRTLALNPKQILIGGEDEGTKKIPLLSVILITGSTLIPLMALAAFLLSDIVSGLLIIGVIVAVYVAIAGMFTGTLALLYKHRAHFSFYLRSIISQKKADGLFGVVSFTSLFVALTALSTLSLLQISLERYLTQDLARTVPTTYVLDVQPSQRDTVLKAFPDLQLFSSIPARIVAIDSLQIQEELQKPESSIDRELGREFNVTARSELLTSEKISSGTWSEGKPGELSVDEDFAKRSNISLGSTVVVSVQGFEVTGTVTSLRSTDSRSGLPFFYFVFSPQDLANFPGTYFGYAYYNEATQKTLGRFLATEAPNVSVLETQAIGPLILKIVSTLMVMVLVVTLPPLLIATLLISTLVVSSFAARRREGARLRAIGASQSFVLKQYLLESVSLTLVAAVLAYVLSIAATYGVSQYFLKLDSVAFFDLELFIGLGLIVVLVAGIALHLFKTDKMPLRELLSYGEHS